MELRRPALDDELSLPPLMAAAEREGTASVIEGFEDALPAWLGQHTFHRVKAKAEEEAESALYGMAEDKCETTDLITAAAGPEIGAAATTMIEESLAEQQYFCLSAEFGIEREPSFGLCYPVDLHVREVERPPVTVQDVHKSEFKQVWLRAMHAELEGHKTAGTFATDETPKDVNVITAKWVFDWKTDANGLITKRKATLVARGFGQRYAVDYFETFAATPTMSSIKLVMAVAVQEGWPLYHFDVEQHFVRAKMDTNVFMKLPNGCGTLTGDVVRLEKAIYGVKQSGRQWSLLLNKTLTEDAGICLLYTSPSPRDLSTSRMPSSA